MVNMLIFTDSYGKERGGGVIEKLSPENGKYADIYRQLWKGKRGGCDLLLFGV